ncbi:MAG: TIGR01212 family radical SAM protein [Kiritimatiellales bacterium]|nr:TIGR01212 family radical SAM protein [Kiritimatiellales bacterium]
MHSPYLQYKDYMAECYGEPLFRVPIDFGLGCPNREADGSGGCTFCPEHGARAIQTLGTETVQQQVAEAVRFARNRYNAKKFMAYIQAFSATFGKDQQQKYLELLDANDFTAVSIGTRPDCLTEEAYGFLKKLNRETETWVELGVQTVNDNTLERINRGHGWEASKTAILKLRECDIKVAAHVIIGLPGETSEDFRKTADTLAQLPIDGIKIHNLHIIKGTALAEEYASHPFQTLEEYDYAEHLMDFIRRLPPHIPIMRISTDTPENELIAPNWHMAKGQFRDYVIQQMTCREWRQGDLSTGVLDNGINGSLKTDSPLQKPGDPIIHPFVHPVATDDGSITFWNKEYKEHYHTPAGARLEAVEKYIVPSKLKERLAKGDVALLDVCFGLGYNSLAAMELAAGGTASSLSGVDEDPGCFRTQSPKLTITALEMDRRVVRAAAQNIQALETDAFNWKDCLAQLHSSSYCKVPNASCLMHWGDARYTLTKLQPSAFDLVFLDAFSTQRNSELWTTDFFRKLKAVMKPEAVLLTYCAAIPVRAGLIDAGFYVGETKPIGRQRGGTIAAMRQEDIAIPLTDHEMEIISNTTRGLPYRDPHGVDTNKVILRNRQERISQSKKTPGIPQSKE